MTTVQELQEENAALRQQIAALAAALRQNQVALDHTGQPPEISGLVQNIIERQQVEEKLRESEARYRLIAENAADVIWVMNPVSGKFTYISPSVERLRGYTPQEVMEQPLSAALTPESLQKVTELMTFHMASLIAQTRGTVSFTTEVDQPRKDGSVVHTEVTTTYLFNERGEVEILGVSRDISARKTMEEALRHNESLLAEAQRLGHIGHFEWNSDRSQLLCSDELYRIFELPRDQEVTRQTIAALILPEDCENLHHEESLAFSERRDAVCEYRILLSNGRKRWLRQHSKVTYDEQGKPARMMATCQDITEQKREEGYTRARLRLANLSHQTSDLETLMRAVLDEAETLTESSIGFFHFVDDDQSTIRLQTWSTNTLQAMCTAEGKGEHYPVVRAGVWADGIRQAKACIYNDYMGLASRRELPAGHAPVTRLISIPIQRNHRVVAALGVGNKPQDYDLRDVEVVQRLAEEAFDIVLRQRAEQAMRASEEKYRGLMKSLNNAVFIAGVEGRLVYLNDRAAEQMGGAPESLENRKISELFPEPVASRQLAAIRQVIGSDQEAVFEAQSAGKDGPRWYRFSVQPLHDEEGRVIHALVNITDIHDLKVTQEELIELNRTLEERVQQRSAEVQDLYDHAPTGYHSIDANGRLIRINQTSLDWLGYHRHEVLGRPLTDFLTPASAEGFQKGFTDFRQRGWVKDVEMEFVRKDGSILPVLLSATVIYDREGNYLMSRSTTVDLTERKIIEDTLRMTNAEMERVMRMKDEFLASMSHELRTPLTGILGISESLQEQIYGNFNANQLKALKNIENSGQHLLDLINDILDVAKLEAGKIELHIEAFSLRHVCQSSMQLVKGMAQKKNQQVHFSMQPSEIMLQGDHRRIKQVLVNLLSNAVKYTHPGGSLGLEIEGDLQEHKIQMTVWDTGIGIRPEDMNKLFQPFVQLDSSLARQQTGSGLGLILVRELAELHGGSVQVESAPQMGSRFTVTLPWVPPLAETPLAAHPESSSLNAASIPVLSHDSGIPLVMLVDDDEINAHAVADYLESKQLRVILAHSGREFLERVTSVRPTIILMDIQMPGMDGLEVIRRVRAHEDPAIAITPVIAITALAMAGDREKCLAVGANEYLSKPLSLKNLIHCISEILQ